MNEPGQASAAAEVSVDADADVVYSLLTDLATLAALAEETAAMTWVNGDAARPGATFKGQNRNGWHRWTTTCTVTDAEPGRAFAFDVRHTVLPISHWRYDITPTEGGGCRVTERTWDRRPGWFRKPAGYATGVHDRPAANAAHIQATLERLKQRAEDVQRSKS